MDTKIPTIADLVSGLPRLRVYDEELKLFEDKNPFSPQLEIVDKNTYLGIEVEVENIYAETISGKIPYWVHTEDGSLRNRGAEFITHPIRAWRVEHALTKLFENIPADCEFSERTSIHIHMNIRTLTVDQLEALILTYIVFEKAFFSFVGENRYNNIFCVPVTETKLGIYLKESILSTSKSPAISWKKYSALNLLPITEKGTIEFRHLAGTKDISKIILWINLILSLKVFALKNNPSYIWDKIKTLNTTSQYRIFGEEVFGTNINLLHDQDFNSGVEKGIIYVKQYCIVNEFEKELQKLIHSKIPTPYTSFNFGDSQETLRSLAETARAVNQIRDRDFETNMTQFSTQINTIRQGDTPTPTQEQANLTNNVARLREILNPNIRNVLWDSVPPMPDEQARPTIRRRIR